MSKHLKALERIRNNRKNVRYEELESILLGLGFTLRKASGSHRVFSNKDYTVILVEQKPFLNPYLVDKFLKVVDEFLGEEGLV